jgi:LytS/YehU family sensor histidine kinase
MASLVLLAALVLGGWWRQAYGGLALFSVLLLTAGAGTAGLLAVRPLLPESASAGWTRTWLALAFGMLAGASLATWAYQAIGGGSLLIYLSLAQVFLAALGFGALVLAMPLAYAQRQSQALHLASLEQAALSAELLSLQAQVEPHFLYNTLANTRYLARHAPEKAVQMLDHLIAYLHTALPDLRAPASTLGREFELAEHYLALMAIRFGERLSYQVDCPPPLAQASLPPLMLMTLVENAVQHGVEPKPGAVNVRVSASLTGQRLTIVVSDDGAGLQDTVFGTGVGLRNLRERLSMLYGGKARFELRAGADGRTESILELPYAGDAQ